MRPTVPGVLAFDVEPDVFACVFTSRWHTCLEEKTLTHTGTRFLTCPTRHLRDGLLRCAQPPGLPSGEAQGKGVQDRFPA